MAELADALSPGDEAKVEEALSKSSRSDTFPVCKNAAVGNDRTLLGRDFVTLRRGMWLTDEVIRGYLHLLQVREGSRGVHKPLRVSTIRHRSLSWSKKFFWLAWRLFVLGWTVAALPCRPRHGGGCGVGGICQCAMPCASGHRGERVPVAARVVVLVVRKLSIHSALGSFSTACDDDAGCDRHPVAVFPII